MPLRTADSDLHSSTQLELQNLQRFRPAVRLLYDAWTFGTGLARRRAWQFALEMRYLEAAGLTPNDLRWLISRGLVDHRDEQPSTGKSRHFRPTPEFALSPRSCFLMTLKGASWAEHLLAITRDEPDERFGSVRDNGFPKSLEWNERLCALRCGDRVVKEFGGPADNQVLICRAFQEQDWEAVIDDPLPWKTDIEPRERLHWTVRRLNGHQRYPVVKFRTVQRGQGVAWGWRPFVECDTGATGAPYERPRIASGAAG